MGYGSKHRKTESGHKSGADGRWEPRAYAKDVSKKARRVIDRLINERYDDLDDIDIDEHGDIEE